MKEYEATKGLVTIQTLCDQIKFKENIGVELNPSLDNQYPNRLVRSYNYDKIDENLSTDDKISILNGRLSKCLEPFKYYINSKGELL